MASVPEAKVATQLIELLLASVKYDQEAQDGPDGLAKLEPEPEDDEDE